MKKSVALMAALTVALGATQALAQPAGPDANRPGPDRRPPPGDFKPPMVAALDANDDGVIDEAEINNAPAALRKIDKNNDGQITREELRPEGRGPGGPGGPPPGDGPRGPRPPGGPGGQGPQHPPAPPLIAALDADKDGTLSADETNNASAALRTLDKNNDGQLTPQEIHPPRPGGPRGPGGPGGPREGGPDQRPQRPQRN